jgi:hypothetical protein
MEMKGVNEEYYSGIRKVNEEFGIFAGIQID